MIAPETIARLTRAYGVDWHRQPPPDVRQFCVQGETPLTAAAPAAGDVVQVCGVRVQQGHVLVLHHYELQGYQDVTAPWNPTQTRRENLSPHSIAGKLSWRLLVNGSLAYHQISKVGTPSEGHGTLGSHSVGPGGTGLQPIIVSGRGRLALSIRSIDLAAGPDIAPDGGLLVGQLSGYFLPIPE